MEQLHRSQRRKLLQRVRSRLVSGSVRGGPPLSAESPARLVADAENEGPTPQVAALADAARALDVRAVKAAVNRAFAYGSWERCESLVTGAARLLGEQWADDECTFMDVTLSVSLLQRTMRSTLPADDGAPQGTGRVLLTAAPGSQHTFGMTLTAARLRRAGWDVQMGWPFGKPARTVREVDIVGVSLSGPRDYGWAAKWTRKVREGRPEGTLVLGGWGARGFGEETGIESWGPDRDLILA